MSTSAGSGSRRYQLAPRRRGRWRARLRWVLALAAVVVAAHRWWGDQVEHRLDRRVLALASAGESTMPAALLNPPVPDADNAALDLQAAAAAMRDADLTEVTDVEPVPPLAQAEVCRIEQLLNGHKDALGRVRGARSKPGVDWRVRFRDLMLLTPVVDWSEHRRLVEFLGVMVLYEHGRGRDAEALELVRDLLFVGRVRERMPGTYSHWDALATYSTAAERLAQIAPDLHVADEGTAATPSLVEATIAEMLDDAPSRDGLRRSFQTERVEQLDTIRALVDGRVAWHDLFRVLHHHLVQSPAARAVPAGGGPCGRADNGHGHSPHGPPAAAG